MSEHRHAPHTSKADAVLANLDDLVRSGRNGRGGEPLHDDLKAVLALVASVVRTEYAALAATPAASDGSLDVERLARALRTLGIVPDKTALDDHISDEEWELVTTRTNAQAIAAEYALSESPSEGKTE